MKNDGTLPAPAILGRAVDPFRSARGSSASSWGAMKTAATTLCLLLAALSGHAQAQTSASFKVTEHVVNSGGHPHDGSRPASASFAISHGAIGDAAGRGILSSASYRGDGGFVVRYAPPGEVNGVRFVDKINLAWNYERRRALTTSTAVRWHRFPGTSEAAISPRSPDRSSGNRCAASGFRVALPRHRGESAERRKIQGAHLGRRQCAAIRRLVLRLVGALGTRPRLHDPAGAGRRRVIGPEGDHEMVERLAIRRLRHVTFAKGELSIAERQFR